ncbi:hypothetical protein Esti_006116 [Eimeria stiedai]
MQPGGHRCHAFSKRSSTSLGQGVRSRKAKPSLATRADVLATLERPSKVPFEFSFAVTDTFSHESFLSSHRNLRSRDEATNEIISVAHSPELKLTFTGLASGDILFFHHEYKKPMQHSLSMERLQQHTGAVHCLQLVLSTENEAFRSLPTLGVPGEGTEVANPWLLSGSADRTIKIWSVSEKAVDCIRTLGNHGGTVVSISLCMPYLVFAATDGAIKFWNVEVSRRRPPTVTLIQKLDNRTLLPASPAATKGQLLLQHAWFESVAARWAGDKVRVCAGSTDGSLIILEGGGFSSAPDSDNSDAEDSLGMRFSEWGRGLFTVIQKIRLHSLCTRLVFPLPLESIVATAGSDAAIAVVDPFLGQVWWKQTNHRGVSFSALAWDANESLLLAGDDSGTLSYFNIYSNERVAAQKLCDFKIVHISVDVEAKKIVVASSHSILVLRTKSSAKNIRLTGHEGSVSQLQWMQTGDTYSLLSMAADETLRVFEYLDGENQ